MSSPSPNNIVVNVEPEKDDSGEIIAAVVQAVGLLLTVMAALIGYLINDISQRRERSHHEAAAAASREHELEIERRDRAHHEEAEAKRREHQLEIDVQRHLRDGESKRLNTQMAQLATPMLNAIHNTFRSTSLFVMELVEDDEYRTALLALVPAPETVALVNAQTVALATAQRQLPLVRGQAPAQERAPTSWESDRCYGFPGTPGGEHLASEWEAPLKDADFVCLPPFQYPNDRIYLYAAPRFFCAWFISMRRADDVITQREFPAVVYEAIRAEGADSRLAKRYRQWCRNVWVPSILRMQKIWHEHGSYLQPLPLEDVDQCYKSFLKVVRKTTLGKSLPRAMMYILLDLYADAWRDLLLVWESNDFSRLYPTIGYPYGILIYSIKMHAMLAKRQKDVNGASFLSTNPHTKLEPSPYNASASGEKDAANDDADAHVSVPM